ncbi:MAG: [Fe-Fe] hydrogenase large subunit C-terminal domain-containing protein [Planctomycetota bacterium]
MNATRYEIVGGDYERGGAASRSLKEQLKKVGADPAVVRRAMIAAYEAEMNVVIHAQRGELRASLDNGQLDVEVADEGPGIADIEAALRPGFSTASAKARELGFGAGMGLPNIKKNSDRFAIDSAVGRGTTVRFTIVLRPQALYGAGRNSLHIVAEQCRQSFRCIHACPTQAMRVFRGKPQVLDYLCVDCTACIATCPSGALTTRGTRDELTPIPDAVLVVSPPVLTQFGASIRPADVLAVLAEIGFGEIWVTWAAEEALRNAIVQYAETDAAARPVISPACPAVVNLIETKFPSLIPHVAPFLSVMEALRTELDGRRAVFAATCPSQRTAVLSDDAPSKPEVVLPAALRAAVRPRLHSEDAGLPPRRAGSGPALQGSAGVPPADPNRDREGAEGVTDERVLRATGLRHVMSILNAIEDGLANDLTVVEPWACDEGCFGSPLLADDPFLARRRWTPPPDAAGPAVTRRRARPLTPRPGLRLDDDMTKAIGKLARIDKLRRALPGCDCGWCGSPTCATLAEDIVRGRAAADACVRQNPAQETTT